MSNKTITKDQNIESLKELKKEQFVESLNEVKKLVEKSRDLFLSCSPENTSLDMTSKIEVIEASRKRFIDEVKKQMGIYQNPTFPHGTLIVESLINHPSSADFYFDNLKKIEDAIAGMKAALIIIKEEMYALIENEAKFLSSPVPTWKDLLRMWKGTGQRDLTRKISTSILAQSGLQVEDRYLEQRRNLHRELFKLVEIAPSSRIREYKILGRLFIFQERYSTMEEVHADLAKEELKIIQLFNDRSATELAIQERIFGTCDSDDYPLGFKAPCTRKTSHTAEEILDAFRSAGVRVNLHKYVVPRIPYNRLIWQKGSGVYIATYVREMEEICRGLDWSQVLEGRPDPSRRAFLGWWNDFCHLNLLD